MPLVGPEEVLAVHGLPVVLLVPLHKVQAEILQGPAMLELDEPPQEEGHVEVEHAVVLVPAVREHGVGPRHVPLLQQRGQGRDLEDEPALLDVQGLRRSPHLLARDVRAERVVRLRLPLEWQAQVQVVGHVRGDAV